MDNIARGSLDASNGIAKSTATKQSGNWYRWCTFIKHSGTADKLLGGDPTRAEENPCVIIRRLSATKLVWQNQETNTPPQNCLVRHIGCICIFLYATLERTDPRFLRSNILTLTETTKGIQHFGPNNKTSESYTSKASLPHIQADKHTSEHIHWPTDSRRIFLWNAVMQVLD